MTNGGSIECVDPGISFTLDINPCNSSITVVVMENDTTVLSRTLSSMEHTQNVNYYSPSGAEQQHVNVSIQVVTSDGDQYYIMELESSLGLEFPLAAIPLVCSVASTGKGQLILAGLYLIWQSAPPSHMGGRSIKEPKTHYSQQLS